MCRALAAIPKSQRKDGTYQSQLEWSKIEWESNASSMEIYHYFGGPSLFIKVKKFLPTDTDQTKLWGKSETGWTWIDTPPLGLLECPSGRAFHQYVSDCVPHCVQRTANAGVLQAIATRCETDDSGLLANAARLWTATHLLLQGWQANGILVITDPSSPYYGMQPAPRVIQNVLDQGLESYIAEIELELLVGINKAIKDRTLKSRWEETFSATFILLAVMEKDIWRLMYWIRHPGQWRHPDSARYLIDRTAFQANVLLSHIKIAGYVPAAFRAAQLHLPSGDAKSQYLESNDDSLCGTLTKIVLLDEDEEYQQVAGKDFS
ncbi:hypothetical protein J7T55_010043 [Diaporthe amygdali]|uniref:uncharacterized protein n=1 Tax=Phomopsis amygdali TaxID=1214568 RepID=UPI0022FF4590|nr:uncharacterized protein J7T55_010043 [Diaporthe amygdali]KAJ0100670.1 hypothetical protein J7T55_010043 [Diaporthe amygdali]